MQALVVYGSAVTFLGCLASKIFPRYRQIYHVKRVTQVHVQNLNNNNVLIGHASDAVHDEDTYRDCNVNWADGQCYGIILSVEKEALSLFSFEGDVMQIDELESRGCKKCGYTDVCSIVEPTPKRIPVYF